MSLDSDEDQAASIYTDELVKNAEREAKVREHVSYLR